MWKQHIKILDPKEWYNFVFDEYKNFHRHLDSFDKGVFTRFLPRKENLNVLDMGAWDGRLFKYMKNVKYKEYVACDISEKLLKKHPWKVKKIVCDLEENLPFESEYFDLVTSFFVLEHIENIESLFEEVYRILKSDWSWIIGHFVQRKQFTWKKDFQFRIQFFNYKLEDLEKIARQIWFSFYSLPCYEGTDLIGWVIVLTK